MKLRDGYGGFKLDGKLRQSHRVAWEFTHGPISTGMLVCHRCDNPPCVNPAHLFLGTNRDNQRDMARKKRGYTRERHWMAKYPERVRGEKNRAARLTVADVSEIRRLLRVGEKQRSVALRFGVTQAAISLIWRGKNWGWLPDAA